MTKANEIQHGGTHYKNREYQHWDFVCDAELHYLLGCATKYVSRWQDKGGVQDLDKAAHYLDKARERGIRPPKFGEVHSYVQRFTSQLPWQEAAIVADIMHNDYAAAKSGISALRSAA